MKGGEMGRERRKMRNWEKKGKDALLN